MEEPLLIPNPSSSSSSSSSPSPPININAKPPHRSHSAPPILINIRNSSLPPCDATAGPGSTPSAVKQAVGGVTLYLAVGVLVYVAWSGSFRGRTTWRVVDGVYFAVSTLCTVGYGDVVPRTAFTKLFTCAFILVGLGFVDVLLSGLVTYVLDQQEALLLSLLDNNNHHRCLGGMRGSININARRHALVWTYVMDVKKRRVRVRVRVAAAVVVVAACVAVGAAAARALEGLGWVDSTYLAVASVTTVGYGDYAFGTAPGRAFAALWLPVSTLAVARAFLYLAELRIERRSRRVAEWVLRRRITVGDFAAADLDNDGSISKSEFILFKLREMGKVAEKDILQICDQFDQLDIGNCGKITLSDLIESHQ